MSGSTNLRDGVSFTLSTHCTLQAPQCYFWGCFSIHVSAVFFYRIWPIIFVNANVHCIFNLYFNVFSLHAAQCCGSSESIRIFCTEPNKRKKQKKKRVYCNPIQDMNSLQTFQFDETDFNMPCFRFSENKYRITQAIREKLQNQANGMKLLPNR